MTASAQLSGIASMDVELVKSGELWRLFSGHLAHITWNQYAVDASAFVILFERYKKSCGLISALSLLFLSALAVSSEIIFSGCCQIYAGLSGINCAAFSVILITFLIAHPYWPSLWIIAAVFIGYLTIGDKSIISGVNVAREAHLTGALTGVLFAFIRAKFYKTIH